MAQILPREQTFVAGSTRNFTCIAGGYPEPTFLWQQDGEVLPTGGRFQIDGGYISFRSLKPSDEGEYECIATNSAGTASVRSRLVYIGEFSDFRSNNLHRNHRRCIWLYGRKRYHIHPGTFFSSLKYSD